MPSLNTADIASSEVAQVDSISPLIYFAQEFLHIKSESLIPLNIITINLVGLWLELVSGNLPLLFKIWIKPSLQKSKSSAKPLNMLNPTKTLWSAKMDKNLPTMN